MSRREGTGVDVYTHSEMLPAHYYPAFKKYPHFRGNYGNAWWKQKEEFESFHGPILMTTNCIVPPKDSLQRPPVHYRCGWIIRAVTHIDGRYRRKTKISPELIATGEALRSRRWRLNVVRLSVDLPMHRFSRWQIRLLLLSNPGRSGNLS